MNNNKMLDGAIAILSKLEYCGYEAYIVGGFVRDYLLGNPSHDIDITTNASPSTVSRLFLNSFNKSDKYKTVTVRMNDFEYEVTTYRLEKGYKDHRHPKTKTASKLKDDIKRRDFTINALCFDKSLNLIDLVNGKNDLDNKIIKTVGNSRIRFNEDALRMFRCFRFASRLDFIIDNLTLSAIHRSFYLSRYISKERIKDEMDRMIKEPYFKNYIDLIIKSNILYCFKYVEKALIILKDNFIPISFIELMSLSSFLKGSVDDSLIVSKKEYKEIERVLFYINTLIERKVNYKSLFDLDYNLLTSAFTVISILKCDNIYRIDELLKYFESLPIKSEKELDITGRDIKEKLNLDDSPIIKDVKEYLINEIILGKVKNNNKDLINYLENYEL